ncbi:MAG TPA: hypothetical protein VEV41_27085 [Terriglobales bacterium]|nr:hypothetical protein [Terriglobales bacterium]
MTPNTKRKIQLVLAFAIVLAALRTGWILYNRHALNKPQQPQTQATLPLNPDYYVIPKKLYAYDLKSARQLAKQPVWVKEGYRYTYYPYNPATHRSDFAHEAGLLQPLQKLEIKNVVLDVSPGAKDQRQVMAVFQQDGKSYAFPVGVQKDHDYRIYADEMLYIQDPKQLYKHWPADVWESIEKHQVKAGMNELQADFAIGMGVPERSDDPEVKTVNYPNGGKPLSITYRGGRAVDIKPGPSA